MEDIFFKEQSKISILNAVAEIIASKNNIVDIINEIQTYLKTVIPCDNVIILFNNEESRYFYIIPALNYYQQNIKNEIIIRYSETSITELLRSKTPIIRDDLNIRGNLTPGDLKFLSEGTSSDISVPILHNNRVKAVINLSSLKSRAFNERHQTMAEEVAILLSLAFERIDYIENIRNFKNKTNIWREKYKQLLESTCDPIAIIDSDNDIIYESNYAFEELTGYNSQQLDGMRFSRLHPRLQNHVFNQIIQDSNNGKKSDFKELLLLRKDGKEVSVKLRLTKLDDESRTLLIAVYKVGTIESFIQQDNSKSSIFSTLSVATEFQKDFKSTINSIAINIGIEQNCKYITIHIVNKDSTLKLINVKRLPINKDFQFIQPWLIGLNQGPYYSVVQKKEYLKFNDVYNDPAFHRWIPIAQKLGYRSLISLPLILTGKMVGILSLFFEDTHKFDDPEISILKGYANYLALFIGDFKLSKKFKRFKKHFGVLNKITTSISSTSNVKEVIQETALQLRKILDFDYFLITLFEDSSDKYQSYTITSETYSKVFESNTWNAINDSKIGWIEDFESENVEKFQSKLDALLIARNKYLGTISIASLEPNNYNSYNRIIFEKIASYLSVSVENARLFEEANKRLKEFSSLAELSKSLNTDTELESVLKHVVKTVLEALNADLTTIRFIDDGQVLPGITSNMPESDFEEIVPFEIQHLIPKILEKFSYYHIDNITNISPNIQIPGTVKYLSCLGVPIISRKQVIAVISIYWGKQHSVEKQEINLILTIANQAASIIENVRLYKETLQHSNGLQKTNQELENFVYTVSHDLKSPIVSIQGFTSILLNDFQSILNEESYHYIKRIQSNANQMEALVKDLLELSRIGRILSPFEDVNINDIIKQILNEQVYHIDKKGIKFRVDPNLPVIYCDKKRIRQAFTNLVDNAIKYMKENDPSPHIEIGSKDELDSYLFYIKDNGVGIDKEYHQKIFGLFKRGYNKTDDVNSTGVGLTIVKKIIENHGGKIWVDSEPGTGSTFFFTIPKKKH